MSNMNPQQHQFPQQMINPQNMMGGGPQMSMSLNRNNPVYDFNSVAPGGMGGMAGGLGMQQPNLGGGFPTAVPNMNMQQSMNDPSRQQASSKPPLKVQLTNKEKGYYSNLLMQADPTQSNKVGGQQGVAFFKRSNISTELLKTIWLTAARTSNEYLTRDEFYIALRLIAYAQNGIQPNEDSIRFNIEVELPKFDPAPLAIMAPAEVRQKPEIRAEDIAAALPDLDNLDLGALNNIQSLIPSVNIAQQQKQQEQAQQQMMRQQQMMQKQMFEKAKQSPWFIQQDDAGKYSKIFETFDKDNAGHLPEPIMRKLFEQTQLDQGTQDQVWSLANPRNVDRFDKRMFLTAIHLLYMKKKGSPLPPQVPQETHMSIDPDAFFKQMQAHVQQQMNPMMRMQQPQQMNPQQQFPQGNQIQPQAQPQPQLQPQSLQQQQPIQQQQQLLPPQHQAQQQHSSPNLLDLGSSNPVEIPSAFNAQQRGSLNLYPVQPIVQNNSFDSKGKVPLDSGFQNINVNLNGSGQKKINLLQGTPDNRSPLRLSQQQFNQQQPQFNQGFNVNSKSQQPSPKNASLPPPMKIDPSRVQVRKDEIQFMNKVYSQDQIMYQEIQNENMKIMRQLDELDKEYAQIARNIETQRALMLQERNRNSEIKMNLESKQQEVSNIRKSFDQVVDERLKNVNSQSYSTSNNNNAYVKQDTQEYKDNYNNGYDDYQGYQQNSNNYNGGYQGQVTDGSDAYNKNQGYNNQHDNKDYQYQADNQYNTSYNQGANHGSYHNNDNYDYNTYNNGGSNSGIDYNQPALQQQTSQVSTSNYPENKQNFGGFAFDEFNNDALNETLNNAAGTFEFS